MAAKSPYQKLPGVGSSLASRTRLYLADDHLLSIESTGYTERYRRYYYRDILAISMRRNRDFELLSVAFLILPILFAIIAVAVPAADGREVFIVFALLGLVPLGVNMVMGPTCVCEVYTAASRDTLGSLKRIKRARSALDLIRPRIEAAQGALGAEEMGAGLADYDARILRGPSS